VVNSPNIRREKNKPKYLFLENVDRLLKSPAKQRGRDFAVMLQSLNDLDVPFGRAFRTRFFVPIVSKRAQTIASIPNAA
jgi:site-specific DNA-cytosine methylase